MIVTCTKCHSAFDIQDHLIPPNGRKMRCFNCKHVFHVKKEAEGGQAGPEAAAFAVRPEPAPSAAAPVSSSAPASVSPPAPSAPPVSAAPVSTAPALADDDEMEGGITQVDFAEEALESLDTGGPRYADLGVIGEGGMGQIKLARDTRLLRKVAVKTLRPEAANPAAMSYFFREAQITAQLDHPNIIPLYTVKSPDPGEKTVSFVMKLIKGKTLTDIIREARDFYKDNPKKDLPPELSLNTRLGYFLKVCDGMIYSHRKEVIHRDLKPANIMIGNYGEVYVMDWGIAKMVQEIPETLYGIQKVAAQKSGMDLGGDEAGRIVGTPSYISPEQIQGLPEVGAASDQFSLGVILYELASLKPGRPGKMEKKIEWAKTGRINTPVHFQADRKIAPELIAIIKKATSENPKRRYPSVAAMAQDIRRFMAGDEVSVLPDNTVRRTWRWMNKHRHLTAIAVLAFFLLLSGATIGSLVREKMSLKDARIREKKLTYLMNKVASQAHFIDSRFIRMEDLLARLTTGATYLLEQAPDHKEKLYFQSDFNDPEKAPPDLAHASLYDKDVSIAYPVAKLAPGADKKRVLPILRRLAPMRHLFQRAMLDSRGSFAPVEEEEARDLLTKYGVQVIWTFIGLESGAMFSYPGKGTYKEDYDPRIRPWYLRGKNQREIRWGKYGDIQGLGQLLYCATSVYDGGGNFVGVAAMDITVSSIIRDSLIRKGAVGLVESYLLDDKGHIITRSSHLEMGLTDSDEAASSLELFSIPEVVARVRRSESGYEEIQKGDKLRIVFFHAIPSLGWFYAEEVNSSSVLGKEG
ncbi:MAG: hypothetical protein CSB33_00055 [Desulfobacterales bacterium]|nr:MAG: hypothetical protein CSB33_00055 [Desulfobacterales bacterium]